MLITLVVGICLIFNISDDYLSGGHFLVVNCPASKCPVNKCPSTVAYIPPILSNKKPAANEGSNTTSCHNSMIKTPDPVSVPRYQSNLQWKNHKA